jgi:hypothetical protein
MKDQASDAWDMAVANRPAPRTEKAGLLARLARCHFASIAPMMALLLIPISGAIAFATELGGFYYVQRSAQNAADSAAIAAATNNNQTGTGSTYLMEARAAAKPYGFVNGQGNQTVTAAVTTCPAGTLAGATCYEAIVSSVFPISFASVIGFVGDQASGRGQRISARAVAVTKGGSGTSTEACIRVKYQLQTNGTPDANLSGCAVISEGGMTCTGGGLHADYAYAGGTVSGSCAEQTDHNLPMQTTFPPDDYQPLAAANNLPSKRSASCGSSTFPQLVKTSGKWGVPAANKSTNEISAGTPTWAGTEQVFCGDVQLTGDVTLTGTSTLIIENGRLDLNGHTISTPGSTAAATIVFSGDNASASSHYPTSLNGGGAIDIKAPTASGAAWKGVAIYQDPNLTSNVGFTYTGNDPAWKITGVVYLPNATTTFSGIVNKASSGATCLILIGYSVTINGTGKIIGDNTDCDTIGIDVPTITVALPREKLVL